VDLIHSACPESMAFRRLCGELRLITLSVKRGAKRAGETWLETVITPEPDVAAVFVTEDMVDADGPVRFLVFVGRRETELEGAGYSGCQRIYGQAAAATARHGHSACRSGTAVIHAEDLFIKRNLRGVANRD